MAGVVLPERLLVAQCAALREEILASMSAGGADLVLDAGAVNDIDGAGLQLLLSAELEARHRSIELRLRASRELLEQFAFLGLIERFKHLEAVTP